MASEYHNAFSAGEYDLEFKSGKPLVGLAFLFYEADDTTEFIFTGHTNATFKIWEDAEDGKILLSLSRGNGLIISGNTFSLDASVSQMGIETGRYYYELSWYNSGGYEILLSFGEAKFN